MKELMQSKVRLESSTPTLSSGPLSQCGPVDMSNTQPRKLEGIMNNTNPSTGSPIVIRMKKYKP